MSAHAANMVDSRSQARIAPSPCPAPCTCLPEKCLADFFIGLADVKKPASNAKGTVKIFSRKLDDMTYKQLVSINSVDCL